MLLLNKTRLGLSLIDRIVHSHPSFVTTRKNNTALPLELWDMIIKFALEKPHRDEYALVRPRASSPEEDRQRRNVSAQTLVCDEYEFEVACGEISEDWLTSYCILLYDPESDHDNVTYDEVPLPEPTGNVFTVDLGTLNMQGRFSVEVLFLQVEVPDVIARLEKGRCSFCWKNRTLCPSYREGSWASELFGVTIGCGFTVPCPFCIGMEYTSDGLDLCREERRLEDRGEDGEEIIEELWDEFYKELDERMKELGYTV